MTDEGQHEWVQPAAFTYGFEPAAAAFILGVASAAETVRSVMIDGGDMSTFDTHSDNAIDTTSTALSNSCAAAVDPLGHS
jgi:hypothetical protein